jgi:hypothetical protein
MALASGSFNFLPTRILYLPLKMPLLPLELEREILELTTRAAPDDRALRCRLMLIARRTRIWCEDLSLYCQASPRLTVMQDRADNT